MKSFHITVSEGTGDPVWRSVSEHPPRLGIFRGDICGMRSSGGAPQACPQTTKNEQIRPTTRPWFLLSKPLSSFHPPSLRHTQCDLPLSSLSLHLCLRNVQVCLFSVQTRCLGREGSHATKSKFSGEPHHGRNIKAAGGTRPGNLCEARMLAKPIVSELAFCSTRQIWQDCCLEFEASNDWPHYTKNFFVLAN
jgi:hypothetical protein